ncbi:MAG: MopE-related protein [Myxococcota bacterium]
MRGLPMPPWSLVALLIALVGLGACGGRSERPLDLPCPAEGCLCTSSPECPVGLDCIDGRCARARVTAGLGDFGALCEIPEDCLSSLCVPAGDGSYSRCSQACPPECPSGWRCADGQCIEDLFRLCLPCQADADCHPAGADVCAFEGGETGLCRSSCASASCPSGYTCSDLESGGQLLAQCLPDEGCDCSTPGFARACTRENALGTCFGQEVCSGAGFGACSAPEAAAEACNGRDDDCDGLVDAEDPSLLPPDGALDFPNCALGEAANCVGTWTCTVAASGGGPDWACVPSARLVELCNGEDDDCDGEIDEDFRDGDDLLDVAHCGACQRDCRTLVPGLAVDDGGQVLPGAVACERVDGVPTCVPQMCAPGRAPAPEGQPEQCEEVLGLQCLPCAEDRDCVWSLNRCVTPEQDASSACAQGCDIDAPYPGCTGLEGERGCCPEGHLCQRQGDDLLCQPEGGSCGCGPDLSGRSRPCFRDGDDGALCSGRQLCEEVGGVWQWSACEGDEVSRELCNGLDDDCDGEVDESFVNTQGSGSYDTDAHCGRCFASCLVLPRADGRCDPGAGPGCAIERCQEDEIRGGGGCRSDAECPAGLSCDADFGQCVGTCSSDADCGSGLTCAGGQCSLACGSNADCESAFGAPSACFDGACGIRYQFVDLDEAVANGCECAASLDGSDEPETFDQFPATGARYVDRNCDGIDGVEARSLFVRAGATGGDGSRLRPFGTLAAAQARFSAAAHDAILVAAGRYDEVLRLRNGVRIYGGYAADFLSRDISALATRIAPSGPRSSSDFAAVIAQGLPARTVLAGVTVEGWDVSTRATAGSTGDSTHAVIVRNASGLELADVRVVAGRAGDGGDGRSGNPGTDGGDGGQGLNAAECTNTSCAGQGQSGGAGGRNASCASANGNRGGGASGNVNQQEYTGSLGLNGRGGENATYNNRGDPSFATLCKYDCTVPQDLEGDDARSGTSGSAGRGGLGCSDAGGRLGANGWEPRTFANDGRPGQQGQGGGGGGAGGGVRNSNGPSCTVGNRVGDLGATGGGGGAGGCAGSSGGPGGHGGASIGIAILDGTQVSFRGVVVEMGDGGGGGTGGDGGRGGRGGHGGLGGVSSPPAWCGGSAGRGGRGGDGGSGGGGGGGCGGPSFGVMAPNAVAISGLEVRPLGRGGGGGEGGRSPSGGASAGTNGAVGVSEEVRIP